MKSGREETRRLLERVLENELEAFELYGSMIPRLKKDGLKKRVLSIRETEMTHAELVKTELKRFQG